MAYLTKLEKAVKDGDRREMLVQLSRQLSKQIAHCSSGRDMAANSKRLMEVMRELESMPDPNKPRESAHDRLKKRAR